MLEGAKQFDLFMIDKSPEIQAWLGQFSDSERKTAISLLLHLDFVSRDRYSDWLTSTLAAIPSDRRYAVYAIRKLGDAEAVFFDQNGDVVPRPSESLGSEDLVYSLISTVTRRDKHFVDHPSLQQLKTERIHDYIIIDDSIGSGKRVSDFVCSMLGNKTFRSWWSYGLVKFHVIAIARMREAEDTIIDRAPGSDHPKRRYRKSDKFNFVSELVYSKDWLSRRWGSQYHSILDLCEGAKKIPTKWRKGFGGVMGNLIFYHSVPNNIPGCIFCRSERWVPLFPGRSVPDWTPALLERTPLRDGGQTENAKPSFATIALSMELLRFIKRGVRLNRSLALRLDCDCRLVDALLDNLISTGLVSEKIRLTKTGADILASHKEPRIEKELDSSIYVPRSWCTGQLTTQPSDSGAIAFSETTDPADDSSAGGEVGQTSLARTDAKAAPPPLGATHSLPAVSGDMRGAQGPKGLKEK